MRCSVAECRRTIHVKTRRLCSGHYQQWLMGKGFAPLKEPVLARDEYGNKLCSRCKNWKAERAFASSSGKRDHLQAQCRKCKAEQYEASRLIVRDKRREARFGMKRADFDTMFAAQGESCAICQTTTPGTKFWSVDHDHACCPPPGRTCGGCVRGILCTACNHALGLVNDNPETLRRAIDYLSRRVSHALTMNQMKPTG